jgi:hypothetical protein
LSPKRTLTKRDRCGKNSQNRLPGASAGVLQLGDSVDPAFFQELVEYLRANDLTNLLGLQVLAKEVPEMMCEFTLKDNGTVILDARDVKNWTSYRFTGFALNGPGMTDIKGDESHAKTNRDTHQVFIDGKIGKEDPLMDILRAEDIIHRVVSPLVGRCIW